MRSNIERTASGARVTTCPFRTWHHSGLAKCPKRPSTRPLRTWHHSGVATCPKRSWLAPARDERVLEPDVVEGARDDEVDEVVDGLRARVEPRREEEDRRARAAQRQHVLEVDRRQRGLARAEDELALLLERNRRGAMDDVLHRAGRE